MAIDGLVVPPVVALICHFGMKEHTHLAFLANTFPQVDTFRRMSVKTCLFSVTLSVIKIKTRRFCQSLLKGWLSVRSPSGSLDLRLEWMDFFCPWLPPFLCRIMFETAKFVLWNSDLQRPIDCNVLSLSCSFSF